ncbi:MAG: YcjF family protein [Clostridia bacterium]|nr:YcjF family protein [Clostridia bacterium]
MEKKKREKVEALPSEQTENTDGNKLTIYEYEQKYVKRQNIRGAKVLLRLIATAIGIFLFACLFFIALRIYEINEYAGYGTGGVCLLLYICLFIVPLVKIMKSPYFVVNVNARTAGSAKKHNRKVRREIADKIIDLTGKVEGVGWYDSAVVGELAISVKTGDDKGIMRGLTNLYTGSVKKSAQDLIFKSSMKSAMYSALSQTSKVDAALVVFINLQLVKDLVFLYGFRPSDAKLVKIFGRVLQNSLVAYGLGGVKIGNSIVKTMGDAVKGIPFLGSAISALVDSSVQGLTNGVLTAVMGYQTIRYLSQEYRLQQILDGVELAETEEELQETCQMIEKELKTGKKAQVA